MALHTRKSWRMFFEDIYAGIRTSDIRSEDRGQFHEDDELHLREWDPVKGTYTGREMICLITYVQRNKSNPCAISSDALKEGYCVLSIRPLGIIQ